MPRDAVHPRHGSQRCTTPFHSNRLLHCGAVHVARDADSSLWDSRRQKNLMTEGDRVFASANIYFRYRLSAGNRLAQMGEPLNRCFSDVSIGRHYSSWNTPVFCSGKPAPALNNDVVLWKRHDGPRIGRQRLLEARALSRNSPTISKAARRASSFFVTSKEIAPTRA